MICDQVYTCVSTIVGRSLDEDEDTLAADLQLGDDVPFTPIRNDPFSRAYIYVASTEKQLQLRWPFEGDITPKTGHVECPHHENVVRFDLYRLEEDDVAEDELPDDNGENRSDTRSDMIRASLNSRTSSGPISRTMTAGPVRAVKVRENIDVVFHNNRLMNDRRGVVMLAGLAQQALDGVVYESASEFEPDVSVAPGGVGDATAYSSSVLASRQSGIMQGGNQLADNDRATSGLEGGDVDDDFLYDFETHSNEVKLQSGVYFFRLQDEDALQQMLQPVDDSENGEPRGVESYRFYWDVPV